MLDIAGVTSEIVGVTSGIHGVLEDLGAKVVGQELRIDLASDVLFDFDKYTLRPEADATLRKVGQVAAAYPNSPMRIEGHTDGKGLHDYNMKLSDNRARLGEKLAGEEFGHPAGAYQDPRLGRNQTGSSQ